MIYIIIILSSIMAFYFFTIAYLDGKEDNKKKKEYLEPKIEKTKDISNEVPVTNTNKVKEASSLPRITNTEKKDVRAEELYRPIEDTQPVHLPNQNEDKKDIFMDEEII